MREDTLASEMREETVHVHRWEWDAFSTPMPVRQVARRGLV